MKFTPLGIADAYIVDLRLIEDERGFFARAWCENEFQEQGIGGHMVQANISYNGQRGMLRGLHWQAAPHAEAKYVRCIRGSIFDVLVDIRPGSSTFKQWFGVELSAINRKALYIPAGCAHGYQVLEDKSEVFYQVSACYAPEAERGARWDDPAFAIEWPIKEGVILSPKDNEWDNFV